MTKVRITPMGKSRAGLLIVMAALAFSRYVYAAGAFDDLPVIGAYAVECTIVINGEISKSLSTQLAAAFAQVERRKDCSGQRFVQLNSLGGDVESALQAGKIIRDKKAWTVVPKDASCASACTLAFLGGVNRVVVGRFGLHRPYKTEYSTSTLEARKSYDQINDAVRKYLSIMNIPEAILAIMNSVPPSEIKWITNSERKTLFIEGKDPVWQDETDSAYAKRLGISKQELYAREQRANAMCKMPSSPDSKQTKQYFDCYFLMVEGKPRR